MEEVVATTRWRVVLPGVGGVGLILLGAAAYLWIIYDDRLPTVLARPTPGDVGLWAIVRVAAAAALAGGSWLLAVAWIRARGHKARVR